MDDKLLVNLIQGANRISVSRSTLYKLIQSGQIRPIRIGRSVRISVEELDRFVEQLQQEQAEMDGER